MESAEMSVGRVFVLRLHTGEVLHEAIESFAKANGVKYATLTAVGGVNAGSKMVVGPKLPADEKIEPLVYELDAPHEMTGTGTLFPDENGDPIMHMHGSVGREGRSSTGCFRAGMIVWLVLEVTITELKGSGPIRKIQPGTNLQVLEIE